MLPKTLFSKMRGSPVYCGDCREILSEPSIRDFSTWFVTDPPYLVSDFWPVGSDWGKIEGDSDLELGSAGVSRTLANAETGRSLCNLLRLAKRRRFLRCLEPEGAFAQ